MSILDNLKWLLGSGVTPDKISSTSTPTTTTTRSADLPENITEEELIELWLPVLEEYAEKQRKEKQARDQEKKKKNEETLKKTAGDATKILSDPILVSQEFYDILKKEKQRQEQVQEKKKESESSHSRVTNNTISTATTTLLTDDEKKELLHNVSTTYSLPKEYYEYLDMMNSRYTGKEIKKWYRDAMEKQIEKYSEELWVDIQEELLK